MPATTVTLSGYLDMPNGQSLWADEVRLEVDYEVSRDFHRMDCPWADVDYTVTDVLDRIIATDDQNNEVILSLSADHPAITQLVRRKSSEIEDDCLSDWHLEAA